MTTESQAPIVISEDAGKTVEFYNLDVIVSLGHRVKSRQEDSES